MLTDFEKIRKSFFSHWGPPTLLCGVFVGLGVTALLWRQDLFGFAILSGLGVLLWLFFFQRVRFEETYATIYYCTFFPVRIDYAEINRLKYFYQKYKKQEIPAVIYFHLHSGKVKSWNINLFSPQTALNIKNELEKRIDPAEKQKKTPDFELWINNTLRSSHAEKIVWAFFAVLTLGLGVWEMTEQLAWDKRIKTWDKVDGIILKNTTKRISEGKRTREVADVEYRYTCKGKQYHGTKIVYDSDTFPNLKVGSKRQVIVNPENPQECAIMFWYRGQWRLIRWLECAFCYLLSLVFSTAFCRTLSPKKITVSGTLKNYINSIPPECFYTALDMERSAVAFNTCELRQKMEFQHNFRYGFIRQNVSMFTYIIWSVLLLLSVITSVFIPLCWLTAAIIGFVVYSLYTPRMTVFDFQGKKIFFCRNFTPEKSEKLKALSFAKVDHLCCNSLYHHNRQYIGVFAVTHDGYKLPLFKVTRKRLDLLCELLPELAEKMGHLPITY